jgi:type I restriction enzyme S subunit
LYYALSWVRLDDASRDSAIPGLDRGEAYERIIPTPPMKEQHRIAAFLDSHDRHINRLIRIKRRLIELLNAQKQAIIHRAVTRGFDPNVHLKPSGLDWLGLIPENYQRTKLGRICLSIRDGTHNPPPAVEGIHRLLSVRNIIDGRFVTRADDRTMSPAAFDELQRSYTVNEGDVVLVLVGATTGKSAVVEQMKNVTVQRSIGILRPSPMVINSHFLDLVISSEIVQSQIRRIMDKYAAQPGIYLKDVSALQIIFPDINTQQSIVATVLEQSKALDVSIKTTRNEIDLLREYRTRLIADVVTGKLDVHSVELPVLDEAEAVEDWETDEDAQADEIDEMEGVDA